MHVVVVAVDVESCKIAALSIAERGIAIAQISRNAVGEGIGAAQAYVPGKIGVHVGAEFGGISKGCEYLALCIDKPHTQTCSDIGSEVRAVVPVKVDVGEQALNTDFRLVGEAV